jgi:hypothetical protein
MIVDSVIDIKMEASLYNDTHGSICVDDVQVQVPGVFACLLGHKYIIFLESQSKWLRNNYLYLWFMSSDYNPIRGVNSWTKMF